MCARRWAWAPRDVDAAVSVTIPTMHPSNERGSFGVLDILLILLILFLLIGISLIIAL